MLAQAPSQAAWLAVAHLQLLTWQAGAHLHALQHPHLGTLLCSSLQQQLPLTNFHAQTVEHHDLLLRWSWQGQVLGMQNALLRECPKHAFRVHNTVHRVQ
jgi:hypothetical protein